MFPRYIYIVMNHKKGLLSALKTVTKTHEKNAVYERLLMENGDLNSDGLDLNDPITTGNGLHSLVKNHDGLVAKECFRLYIKEGYTVFGQKYHDKVKFFESELAKCTYYFENSEYLNNKFLYFKNALITNNLTEIYENESEIHELISANYRGKSVHKYPLTRTIKLRFKLKSLQKNQIPIPENLIDLVKLHGNYIKNHEYISCEFLRVFFNEVNKKGIRKCKLEREKILCEMRPGLFIKRVFDEEV